jgi:hypothetical protein
MPVEHIMLGWYLGILVFGGNFLVMRRCIRTYQDTKKIETRVINILRARRGRR